MRNVFIVPVLALVLLAAVPTSTQALSCIDPEGMVDYIVKNPDSIVVTAKALEQKEHIKEHANKKDPNAAFNSGYTGQLIEVKKAHMGSVPNKEWVYFTRNGTWNYLCAGEPPKIGTEAIYVINPTNSLFEPQTVTITYPVQSDMGKNLLKKIADTELVVEPTIEQVSADSWTARLRDELTDMAFIIKVKLTEWQFWKMSK